MRRPAAAVILIISLFLTGLAIAGPFEDATKAYGRGDYETAYRLINHWRIVDYPKPSSTSASCTPTDMAYRRTTARQ